MASPTDPELSPDLTLERDGELSPPSAVSKRGARRRRSLLTISGLGLLGLGAFLNAERLGLDELLESESESERTASAVEFAELVEEEPPPEESERFEEDPGTRHRGEEGKMGKPTAKSGLYAMKGPLNAVPQMSREFEPSEAARVAGIMGVMEQQQGHFLASPYGGAMAVGNDDEDVWGGLTGSEVGEAYGVGGLGLVGTGRGGGGIGEGRTGLIAPRGGEFGGQGGREEWQGSQAFDARAVAASFVTTAQDPKSTFSIDVDTAAYAVARQSLQQGSLPDPSRVRTEEMINYFDYGYVPPASGAPFSVNAEVGPCPWAEGHRLVQIGVQGATERPAQTVGARNLVFLLDVSGSMSGPEELPLIVHGFTKLVDELGPEDRVSIVVYAGAAGVVLPPTPGDQRERIFDALARLEAGGGTNGGEGIEKAYALAEANFVKGGVNRVIIGTDGDFNVGMSDHHALVQMIERKREGGVYLSVLGVGSGHFNDELMEQLADHGNGNYAYLDGEKEAEKVLVQDIGGTLRTLAKDVKIQVEFDDDQVAEHRLIAYQNRRLAHQDFADDTKDAGEIGVGHNVTALYEIVPKERTPQAKALGGDALVTLKLRYKEPDESRSKEIVTAVRDDGRGLDESSEAFRFSAAVASFGETLAGRRPGEGWSFGDSLALAQGAVGADQRCLRHEFVGLVWQAGAIVGEELPHPNLRCEPGERTPTPTPQPEVVSVVNHEVNVDMHLGGQNESASALRNFALEVLRLLPPLLALPLFVMAWLPRRRR